MDRATDYTQADLPGALIVAGADADADDAAAAVALAGGRVAARIGWCDVGARLAAQGAVDLIALEARGASDSEVAAAAPHIDALADASRARVVVALAETQIDLVAGMLLRTGVDLLCTPTLAERTAAFAVALGPFAHDRMHDPASSGEAAQLRQLNEEVARIAKVLTRLASEEKRPGGVADRALGYGAPPAASASPAAVTTAADIRKMIRARRLRDHYVTEGLFEDPAWDMLLDLYAAELEGGQVSVSSLCIAAAVAPTTALRWIARMTEAGLFERHPDPFDRRRAFLGLSPATRARMERYFTALRQGGLDIT